MIDTETLPAPAAAPEVLATPVKRNFTRLPVPVDADRLIAEYNSIPDTAWGVSHWDVHCSIDVLLLRGGAKGDADDFVTEEVKNNPILEQLPYISWLISEEGPYGGAVYAFIFKTKPNGITRIHRDGETAWRRATRVHMPIITNPGAFLMAEGRAKHLEPGEAWTFDNQSLHSVVNGAETRVHLIIDVNPNRKLIDLFDNAVVDPGDEDPVRWDMTRAYARVNPDQPLKFTEDRPLTIAEKREAGLDEGGFATRVVKVTGLAKALGTPIRAGDIVVAVDGVSASPHSRSALDHMRVAHKSWQTATLDIIRAGARMQQRVLLWPDYISPTVLLRRLSGKPKLEY